MLRQAQEEQLRATLRGQLIARPDGEYEAARKVFNAMIDRRPALIARCVGAADVISCVKFAREHNLPVSMRCGGHNVSGSSICDDGLVIDLSRMKTIRVDPARHVARADPGLLLGEFDRETQAFGLATTLGTFSVTGITGLTLGGGLGWLMGKYGLACDNLISADVVTADGHFLTASADENPDLFWALRGGSGNFGVVTSLEYRLHPVGPVLGGMVAYPVSETRNLLDFLRDYSADCPDELGFMLVVITIPDGNTVVAVGGCYSGDLSAGEKVLQPLRTFGKPVADTFQPMPYIEIQKATDWWAAPGQQHYWKSGFLKDMSDSALDTITDFALRKPSSGSAVAVEFIQGEVRRIPSNATAFPHRAARSNLLLLGRWTSASETQSCMTWIRDFWEAMRPAIGTGVYVNYLSNNEGEDRVRAAYGSNYERLAQLKAKYDPTNFFRLNQNIRPASAQAAA